MDKQKTLWELFRYIFAGGAAFAADFGTLVLCRENLLRDFAGGVYISVLIAFLVGHVVNYILSLYFVFTDPHERKRGLTWRAFLLFSVVGGLGAGLTELGMLVGYGILHFNYMGVKILMAVVVTLWNFAGRKLIVMRS